ADFDVDRPDFVERAAVEAGALAQHDVAQDLLFEHADDLLDLRAQLGLIVGHASQERLDHAGDRILALKLALSLEGLPERPPELRRDALEELGGIGLGLGVGWLRGAALAEHGVLGAEDLLDLGVALEDAIE